jgi:hypothetical protein
VALGEAHASVACGRWRAAMTSTTWPASHASGCRPPRSATSTAAARASGRCGATARRSARWNWSDVGGRLRQPVLQAGQRASHPRRSEHPSGPEDQGRPGMGTASCLIRGEGHDSHEAQCFSSVPAANKPGQTSRLRVRERSPVVPATWLTSVNQQGTCISGPSWDPEFMMLVDPAGRQLPVSLQLAGGPPAEPVRTHLDLYTGEQGRHVER